MRHDRDEYKNWSGCPNVPYRSPPRPTPLIVKVAVTLLVAALWVGVSMIFW